MSKHILYLIWLSVFTVGCANHHCRVKKEGVDMAEMAEGAKIEKILVAKPDGSQQCEATSGIPLDRMAQDLSGIQIYRQFKANDGMMRIQVCGAPTGMYNVYEIDAKNRQKALDVGFEIWKGPAK